MNHKVWAAYLKLASQVKQSGATLANNKPLYTITDDNQSIPFGVIHEEPNAPVRSASKPRKINQRGQ